VSRVRLLALALTVSLALAAPAAAGACEQELGNPFAPFGDLADYAAVPDGGFEQGAAGWTLEDGAAVVDGNEPWQVGGPDDAHALALPAGSSALSPRVCITEAHPTIRFFADGSGPFSVLVLSAVLGDDGGRITELPVGLVAVGAQWQPTAPTPILVNRLAPLAPDGQLWARFRLTPLLGSMAVDDIYVDPWKTT
jgi:hypothetical protein